MESLAPIKPIWQRLTQQSFVPVFDVHLADDIGGVHDDHVVRCHQLSATVEDLSSPRQELWFVKQIKADVDSSLIMTLDLQNEAGAKYDVAILHYAYDHRVVDGVLRPVR